MQELAQFLAHVPRQPAVTLHNCNPLDLLVFLQTQYSPQHAGSVTPQQAHVMAPGSLKNAISALSQGFQELDRCGPWDPYSCQGNPARSSAVRSWQNGYCKLASRSGYVSRGAKELVETKVECMLIQLYHLMSHSQDRLATSMYARDGFAISLLWSTGCRGITACHADCHEFRLPSSSMSSSTHAVPYIYPTFQLSAGSTVEFIPSFLKQSPQRNSCSIQLTVQPEGSKDPLVWLHVCMQTAAASGNPISGPIVRPLNRERNAYLPSSLTTKALQHRMTTLLQSMNLYEGESMHSFRRGVAQQMARAGQSTANICARLLNKTPAIVEQHYLPAGRHHSGVQRVRVSRRLLATPCTHASCAVASGRAASTLLEP